MATFLLEVGTEELPANFVESAIEQWQLQVPRSLESHLLAPQTIEVFGTPRRLAILAVGLPKVQPDQTELLKGPAASAAFKDGKPTPAAQGFARKQGVNIEDFELRDTDKGAFVFVHKTTIGQPAAQVLSALIPEWIFGLEGKRFMRWGDGDLRFSRPIRWLVCLLDDQVIPVRLENAASTMVSDRTSWGHRVLHPEPITISYAQGYVDILLAASVQVNQIERQTIIEKQVRACAQKVKGEAVISTDLLQEVTYLVEWPTAVMGGFDPEFLELPPEVITTEMVAHQRYFPVANSKQTDSLGLLPYFITISNGDPAKSEIIAKGNERVIRARLADGQFFYKSDQKIALADYLPKLETVTFQEELGSVRAKVDRIVAITKGIAQQLQLDSKTTQRIHRAALLCKADLVTQMVGEFPELQGIMGQKYAITSGEDAAVAVAISEHYLPKGAQGDLPQTLLGRVVGIADRLDTLVCIFGLGMSPTGSSDPFALRRAANAILNIIWDANLDLNLDQLLVATITSFVETCEKSQPLPDLQQQLQDFLAVRVHNLLQDERGIDYDLVNAVLGEAQEYQQRALTDVLDGRDRAQFLQHIRTDGTLDTIYETVNRATRLAKQGDLPLDVLNPDDFVKPQLFEQSCEQLFYDGLLKLLPQTQAAQVTRDYQKLVQGLQAIAPAVSQFFDGDDSVLVMAEATDLRRNRLNLLGLLRNHALVLGDFGAIVKS
ncbi:MAG: glycine--tRNA ligase subunit beta [Acaryochloris sp. RU_4_1]|nr:glycine--tRNA ligase subunit beta [Acaryochloris sp. RU_4_1]NJR53665.1 glycine--tRNA ligase subunit beta [Acaryochloris sp. CRU_2_0]